MEIFALDIGVLRFIRSCHSVNLDRLPTPPPTHQNKKTKKQKQKQKTKNKKTQKKQKHKTKKGKLTSTFQIPVREG